MSGVSKPACGRAWNGARCLRGADHPGPHTGVLDGGAVRWTTPHVLQGAYFDSHAGLHEVSCSCGERFARVRLVDSAVALERHQDRMTAVDLEAVAVDA